jgi:hypothetical protein
MGPYQSLFRSYVAELSEAKDLADAWWNRLVEGEAHAADSPGAGEARARERWPFGPASHPYVIRVYRKYFLACEQLNEKTVGESDGSDVEPSEADWGTEEASHRETPGLDDPMDIEEPDGPIDSPTFLFQLLHGRRQDLADFMMFLVFAPIGEENDRAA